AYSTGGAVVIGLIVGVLVLLAVFFLASVRRGSWLRSRIAPHTGEAALSRKRRREDHLAALAALFRSTERAFGHLRQWKKVQSTLDRGETPLRAAEFFWIVAGSGLLLGIMAALVGASASVIG